MDTVLQGVRAETLPPYFLISPCTGKGKCVWFSWKMCWRKQLTCILCAAFHVRVKSVIVRTGFSTGFAFLLNKSFATKTFPPPRCSQWATAKLRPLKQIYQQTRKFHRANKKPLFLMNYFITSLSAGFSLHFRATERFNPCFPPAETSMFRLFCSAFI